MKMKHNNNILIKRNVCSNTVGRRRSISMKQYGIDQSKGMEFGIYTLGDHMPNPNTGQRISAKERINEIIELAKFAEQAGIDFFSVGESHQEYFVTQAHSVVLGAIAQATNTIKIGSSSTIMSTSDPVRVYEDFSTIDLISNGRTEIIGGRASRVGLFELLGYNLRDYEELFEEKFELLLKINKEEIINWEGQFRAALRNAKVLPRPLRGSMPIWRGVGGHPTSAVKAGYQGVPMMLAALGGPVTSFKYSIDAYRNTLAQSGFDPASFPVATAGLFYTAETTEQAIREAYPYVNEGMKKSNGQGFAKQHFAQASNPHNVLNVGSPDLIIEKILYQHEVFGHQRYIAQIDFGGVPLDTLKRNVELIGTKILPAVKKYTAKKD